MWKHPGREPSVGVRPRRAKPARLPLAVVALLACLLAPAVGWAGDPDLDWWTIETAHFHIHYEKNLEPVAERMARMSEAIHDRLVGPLGYAPKERTEVLLTDDSESANGSASATPVNTVRLFVTSPGDLSSLGDYDDWQLGLMTHEYTHILHVDNISGIPTLINAILGKTLAPNQLQPRWILEGLAVVLESEFSSGGRIRSSLFDMLLRADYLDDNFAGLDQMSSTPRRYPGANIYYLYGSRFLRWIADVYGLDVLRAVSTDYGAGLVPFGINRAIQRQTGRTYVELYDGWIKQLRRHFERELRAVRRRGLREGKRLTYHGRDVYYPRFVPAPARRSGSDRELVYYRNDAHERGGHYWLDLRQERAAGALFDETLLARTTSGAPASFTPEGDLLFASVAPWKSVYQRSDLFTLPVGKRAPHGSERERQRLTVGLRASDPTLSPDGRTLVFSKNHRGTTTLMTAYRNDDKALDDIRTLKKSRRFDQVYTPVFSPDGAWLAYSTWRQGGFRDIHLLEIASGEVRRITHDRALDTNPAWSPDGDRLYFSSDRSGIFNIYEHRLSDGRLRQVTNVRTGALMPAVSDDGEYLVYVGYTSEGYDLYGLELDERRFLTPVEPRDDRPDPYGEPPPVKMKKERYNPLWTLRPYNYSFEYAPGNFGSNAFVINATGADIVGHHAVAMSVIADPAAPAPQLAFNYSYHRLPVDLGLSLSNRFVPRTDFRINNQTPEYVETSYNLTSSIGYNHFGEFGRQGISLAYTASVLDSDLPVAATGPLDPYASPTIEPLRGFVPRITLAYTYSNVEGSLYTEGEARGFSLRLSLDLSDETIGSEESLYQARYTLTSYFLMPWGYHTLALRSAGGLSKGTFSRRGAFFVGGYNTENTTLLDQVLDNVFTGAFVLRGYEPGAYRGSAFLLNTAEYRIPIVDVDHGISTVPIYLQRIGANLYLDHGGAFDELDFDGIELFADEAIVSVPQLHTGIGAELWITATFGYGVGTVFRFGYAFGTAEEAINGGQPYFIAAGAF
jgi:hypothetical protein